MYTRKLYGGISTHPLFSLFRREPRPLGRGGKKKEKKKQPPIPPLLHGKFIKENFNKDRPPPSPLPTRYAFMHFTRFFLETRTRVNTRKLNYSFVFRERHRNVNIDIERVYIERV